MLTRALLLFGLIAAVTAVAIVAIIQLPEIPLLRYAVLAAPLIGAMVVVVTWYDAGAPAPSFLVSRPRRSRSPARARIVQEGPAPTA